MAILEMQRISIYALSKYCKDILETLQRLGAVQVEPVELEDSVFYKEDSSVYCASYSRTAATFENAAEILCEYVKVNKSLFSALEGRKLLLVSGYEQYAEKYSEYLKLAYSVINAHKRTGEIKGKILNYSSKAESLTPWQSLDIPLDFYGTSTTKCIVGSFPENLDESGISERIAEISGAPELFDFEVISVNEHQSCVFFICHKNVYEDLLSALRKCGFSMVSSATPMYPAEEIKELNAKIREAHKEINECRETIISAADSLDMFRFFQDYYTMKAERYKQLDNIAYTTHTFVLTGYIPTCESEKVKVILTERFDAEVEFETASGDDVPVALKNNPIAEPAEGVVLSYSVPQRGELDPTGIMAIFYYVFFGLMFSDAGYGLVMSLACGFALLKFKNMEKALRKSVKMFFFCGLSTIFWGLMFGSFFGDAVSVVSNTFFNSPPPFIPGITSPIWFNPTVGTGPTTLLMFAFLFGIIHLFMGLILQAVNYIRQGNLIYALYDDMSWILVVTGGVLALLSTDMLSGMMGGFKLDSVFLIIGGVLAGVGAVIILIFSGRESKNPFVRFLKGAYNLYGATSYLSDILSYSRLLALGLATGVVAGVFNQLGAMMGGGVIGGILFTLIFIIGHSLNIGINALGAYVHTNRLQFVEFFGKFYTGGGKEFKPYAVNTKHYNIKEDI